MSNILRKNFNLCFSKLKCPPTPMSQHPPPPPQQSHSRRSSSLFIKNFNTLYDLTSESASKSLSPSTDHFFSSSEVDSDVDTLPDFTTVFASHRFFFSSPGNSNSIVESANTPPEPDTLLVGCGVAVPTYSPDPYTDFRRSMQEMVEARDLVDARANWEYLHELLLCYLALNSEHNHKFIIGAFADLLVCLMSSTVDNCRASDGRRGRAVARRLM